MSAPNFKKYPQPWPTLTHSFLFLYTGFKHPLSSLAQNRPLNAIKRNIKGLNIDELDDIITDEPNKNKYNDEKMTTKHLSTVWASQSSQFSLSSLIVIAQPVEKVNNSSPGLYRLLNRCKVLESLIINILPFFTHSCLLTPQLLIHMKSWSWIQFTSKRWLMK